MCYIFPIQWSATFFERRSLALAFVYPTRQPRLPPALPRLYGMLAVFCRPLPPCSTRFSHWLHPPPTLSPVR
uniref:Uncharacterized protein n=1 Tax=Arundo donax TaxID=35708 RepID=A0A0A9SHB9_ARUDO